MAIPVPTALHRDDAGLTVTWEEGHVAVFPARDLRLACQCAGCRDEMTGRLVLDPESVDRDVRPLSVALVGNYGIQVRWSDGHDAGIYTYEALRSWCPCEACVARRAGAAG